MRDADTMWADSDVQADTKQTPLCVHADVGNTEMLHKHLHEELLCCRLNMDKYGRQACFLLEFLCVEVP